MWQGHALLGMRSILVRLPDREQPVRASSELGKRFLVRVNLNPGFDQIRPISRVIIVRWLDPPDDLEFSTLVASVPHP